MGTDSQINIEKLEAQIRKCYGRITYSHSTHIKSAKLCFKRLHKIKLTHIILSSITTCGIIFSVFGKNQWTLVVTAFFSLALTILTAYNKENNLGELGQKHKDTANDLWNVRESYLSLIADIQSNTTLPEQLRQKRDELQETLANIYKSAPTSIFTDNAYKEAQVGLQKNEEMTFSEDELDNLLPPELRKNNK